MTDTLLKSYIHSIDLNELLRSELTFSDATKIRMYPDNKRLGVRLRGTYNRWAKKIEFPLDIDITVRLPEWSPQAVKSWDGFEEISKRPTGTSIDWRVSDGTNDYWWNGAAWTLVALATDWNIETDVSANLSTFPVTARKIQLVARLTTTDRWSTPILLGSKLLISASFDWFEDLILRSLVPRIQDDFTFLMDWSGVLESDTDRFNIQTDYPFTPEESLNVIGIDAVYNHDADPYHDTDILQSFNSTSGLAILTTSLTTGTRLFYRLNVQPEVAVNFTNTDYDEIGKTPVVIIDKIDLDAKQVKATIDIALKDRVEGRKLDQPLWVSELKARCVLLTGKLVNATRLFTQLHAFQIVGSKTISGHKIGPILKTRALDLEHTMRVTSASRYNPKPNFSDIKEINFEISICNFYAWLRDIETTNLVTTFNYGTIGDMREVGTGDPTDILAQLPAGAIPSLYVYPDVEET